VKFHEVKNLIKVPFELRIDVRRVSYGLNLIITL